MEQLSFRCNVNVTTQSFLPCLFLVDRPTITGAQVAMVKRSSRAYKEKYRMFQKLVSLALMGFVNTPPRLRSRLGPIARRGAPDREGQANDSEARDRGEGSR